MNTSAIRVSNLSKRFYLGASDGKLTFREAIMSTFQAPFKKLLGANGTQTGEEFWALKNINFEIPRGEAVGIIGRNGAGKSTLLKILSKITEPTEGRIEMQGRVGSLLEVGTGFHPELTGRENIYLNGAILGMKRAEIQRKFDEIVAFAEIERFLDTPVKHYSSGMYMRLAFAVAANLETDILMVDEVLAVGDATFQKKCLGKMDDVARHGRTVLFVSHNMEAVLKFCRQGVVLDKGKLTFVGDARSAVEHYQRSNAGSASALYENNDSPEKPHFKRIQIVNTQLNFGDYLEVDVELGAGRGTEAAVEIEIRDERDHPLIYVSTAPMGSRLLPIQGNTASKYRFRIGPLGLASGDYQTYFWLAKPWMEDYHTTRSPLTFTIASSDPCGSGFNFKQSYLRGAITVPLEVREV